MILDEARTKLRVDLADTDEALLTDDVLDRSVQRAVSDLSRFLPLDKVYESTLIFTVTTESWTSAAAAGTYVSLANKPIKWDSETVTNNAGTACVRDTDYYMDYTAGKITHISGERIGNIEACTISYSKSKVTIDISSILEDLIRVERVEYPVGKVPQEFVPYGVWYDLLSVKAGALETQSELTEKDHVAVYYKSKQTGPTEDAEGSYPNFLDDTIILAASAYALFTLALEYEGQAVTDLASLRTALGNISGIHTLASAALDKVEDYLETNNTTDNAVDVLSNITDDIANLRTALAAAMGHMLTYINNASTSVTNADNLLVTGITKINLVNLGSRVAELYGEYANSRVAQATARINAAMAYSQEASAILSNIRSYIEEAWGWNRIAEDFISEAATRISEMDRYLAEAAQYATTAPNDLALANRYREEAIERRNEVWAIWRDAPQYNPMYVISPVRQTSQ